MAALDQNLLIELQRVLAAIARSGSAFQSSLNALDEAASSSAASQQRAARDLRKSGLDAAQKALAKRISMSSKSFDQLHTVVDEIVQGTRDAGVQNVDFIKNIATSYHRAKGLLDDQVSETFTTWGELDKLYPKVLEKYLKAVDGTSLKIKDYAAALKVDEYVHTQEAFLEAMQQNNNKLGEEHLTLLSNLHNVSKELGDDFLKPFAKNATSMKKYVKILDKHAKNITLTADEIEFVNKFFHSVPDRKLNKAIEATRTRLQDLVGGIQNSSQAINQMGGSMRGAILNHINNSFGSAGPAIRQAIATGNIGGAVRGAVGAISESVVKGLWQAGKAALPLFMHEAEEWMKSGTELHDMALINIGIGQDAYLKISAQNKNLYRSMEGGQEDLDRLMDDHAKEFSKVLGGNRELGAEMSIRMAQVERNAGGSSQGLEEFSAGISSTIKWIDELNQTTALSGPAISEMYESILKEGAASQRLTILKDKERLAYTRSIKALMSYTASMGLSEAAMKTIIESSAKIGTGGFEDVDPALRMAALAGMLNQNDKSDREAIDLDALRDLMLNEGRTTEQEKEMQAGLKLMADKSVGIIADLQEQMAAAKQAGDERAVNDINWRIRGQKNMEAELLKNVTGAAKENFETFKAETAKTSAYSASMTKDLATMVGGDTAANRAVLIARKAETDEIKHAAHAQHDLSVNAGEAAISIYNWKAALDNSQTGVIPSLLISAVSGIGAGLAAIAVPVIGAAVGSAITSAIGAGGLLGSIMSLGAGLSTLAAGVLAAGAIFTTFAAGAAIFGTSYNAVHDRRMAKEAKERGEDYHRTTEDSWWNTPLWGSENKAIKPSASATPVVNEAQYTQLVQSIDTLNGTLSSLDRSITNITPSLTHMLNDSLRTDDSSKPTDKVSDSINQLVELLTQYSAVMSTNTNTMVSKLSNIDTITTRKYNEDKFSMNPTNSTGLFDRYFSKDKVPA